MDTLGNLLARYSDDIAKFASAVTCLQFLSGIILLYEVCKKGCSDASAANPFLGGIVLTTLSIKMGTLIGDLAMIKVNIIGLAINVVFMVVFYWYASGSFKWKILSKMGVTASFTMICFVYSYLEDPKKIEFRFGMIITGILVILVGMPLLNLGQIIEKRSTDGLPFPVIFSGTIVAASWAVYGISIRNEVLTYQNLLLLILGSIQLSLFFIYPRKAALSTQPKYSKIKPEMSSRLLKKHDLLN